MLHSIPSSIKLITSRSIGLSGLSKLAFRAASSRSHYQCMSTPARRLTSYSNHIRTYTSATPTDPIMSSTTASEFYSIIAGVGGGTGRSLALKFAHTYPVILLARNPQNYSSIVEEIKSSGGEAIAISTDVTDVQSVKKTFAEIQQKFGAERKLAAAVFNVGGKFMKRPFLETPLEDFVGEYETMAKGFFNFAQAALPLLLESVPSSSHPPTLIASGATASLRGGDGFSAISNGKFAMRGAVQSVAREFGPKGVHVAHVIVDGLIDTPKTKGITVNGGVEDGKISTDAIADSYWYLHTQPRSLFTHEMDVRPFVEKF